LFCGRGGQASDIFLCRTLLQSPTVPALSRREPWFERTICVVRNRIICGYRMLFTGGKTDYTEQTDNCPWQLSAGISNKLQIRNNVTKCPTLPYKKSFIRCVTVGFVGIVCFKAGGQSNYTEQTDNCRQAFVGGISNKLHIRITSRNAPRRPYGRFVYSQGARYIRTKANVIAEDFKGI